MTAILTACGGGNQTATTAAPADRLLAGTVVSASKTPVKVLPGTREQYVIYQSNFGLQAMELADVRITHSFGAATKVRFADMTLEFDPKSNSAKLYRLYRAAFNREPDPDGLGFWTEVLDNGTSLNDVAGYFVNSPEYHAIYDSASSPDQVVSSFYRNALHREGDADGVAFWLTLLLQGKITPANLLVSFSESQENQDATSKSILAQGIKLYESDISYLPVARAGSSQEILMGNPVKLDGSASTAKGKLNYQWKLLLKPGGSKVQLQSETSAITGFMPDIPGSYLVSLVVNDGKTSSEEVTLAIIAKAIPMYLWKPEETALPARGNYVYLQGSAGDFVLGNTTYLYQDNNAVLTFSGYSQRLNVRIRGDENWSGDFVLPVSATKLAPGYYNNATRAPFHDAYSAGLEWSGEGRGCNTLLGWFVIDKVSYEGTSLRAIDLRFEQHCEGGSSAAHGKIHWDASETSVAPVPVFPIPDLWQPLRSATPATGNYVYLESSPGDFIGQGKTYRYTPDNSTLQLSSAGNQLQVHVDNWNATFAGMNSLSELKPGYYGDLRRYPFHNPVKGGLTWYGDGRGCNILTGWFVIDNIVTVKGNLQQLDARFEQHCEANSTALRGKIHWVQ